MAKSQGSDSLWAELLATRLYKRNQGRLVRQLTALAVVVVILFGAWTLSQGPLSDFTISGYVVEIRYSGGADESLESELKQLADQQQKERVEKLSGNLDAAREELRDARGNEQAERVARLGKEIEELQSRLQKLRQQSVETRTEDVGGGDQRSLTFYWPTGRFWSVDPHLQSETKMVVDGFREAAQEQFEARISVSRAEHDVRESRVFETGIPMLIAALGLWFSFRLVNWPRFADFLISVEAEMDKVSWPTRRELVRSSMVVLATMFLLGAVLFIYDIFWRWLFQLTNVLQL